MVNKPLSQKKKELVKKLLDQGMSYREIKKIAKVSLGSISNVNKEKTKYARITESFNIQKPLKLRPIRPLECNHEFMPYNPPIVAREGTWGPREMEPPRVTPDWKNPIKFYPIITSINFHDKINTSNNQKQQQIERVSEKIEEFTEEGKYYGEKESQLKDIKIKIQKQKEEENRKILEYTPPKEKNRLFLMNNSSKTKPVSKQAWNSYMQVVEEYYKFERERPNNEIMRSIIDIIPDVVIKPLIERLIPKTKPIKVKLSLTGETIRGVQKAVLTPIEDNNNIIGVFSKTKPLKAKVIKTEETMGEGQKAVLTSIEDNNNS